MFGFSSHLRHAVLNEFKYVFFLFQLRGSGGKLYSYIRSYSRHSSTVNATSLKRSIPIKFKAVKSLFKSSPIEIPETPFSQLKICDAKTATEEDNTNFSFYDLLQSYYDNAPEITDTLPEKPANAEDIAESEPSTFEEAPHFNLIANDLDVNNILNCSQKLLKSVSSTLKRVQTTTEPNLLCNEIIAKSSTSIESLDQNSNDDKDDDVYYNIIAPAVLTKKPSPLGDFFDSIKLFDVSQLPRAIIRRWFREIIFAVKHLHANDIICYDLQPDNLLLGKNGEILLTYFYRRDNMQPDIFSAEMHQTCYPIVYVAPERPITFASDIFSMGVIFYELLTGYSFQSCHPDGYLSYFDIQYPEDCELDSISRGLIEGVCERKK